MKKVYTPFSFLTVLSVSMQAHAATNSGAVTPGVGLLQISFGLIAVIGVMVSIAWIMKRIGPITSNNSVPLKIVGGISVGNRERVMIVEVADQWLILGVTANNISNLGTMPKQESILQSSTGTKAAGQFGDWLKRTVEKRHDQTQDIK
ncbi:MAG: flagellar biosynthetic protein FliO [Burkholderiales bacterium]|nr:flagellar biosynthetic protein FliO [Burkholderiales bacterium]